MKIGAKVLLLTDFSQISGYATDYALEIASKLKAKVEILHILNTPVDWVKLAKEKEQYYPETLRAIASAKSKLNSVVEEFQRAGVSTMSSLVFNFGPENVHDHVQKAGSDLVIMGSSGLQGSKSFRVIGSNAQRVLRNVKVPVLVVKKGNGKPEIKTIAFATTLLENQKKSFLILKEFAALLGAKIKLVFINTPYNFVETEEFEKRLEKFGNPEDVTLINALDLELGIIFLEKKNRPDVIVTAKTEKFGVTRIIDPSFTENLVRLYDLPVLSFHI
ncbi:MAG: universal stress protein [Algoriphagus sp.]|uniref:universal stress protein n=1 Tax=Algoriphagus sp. TaxID=1872435 RepID=UPI002728380A|nr:universal stress protein [Algoriphagus sp.]MDO8968029.1 universal stress protein [Algoriphagus sp.]MDP2040043.1 universal stress protein [Algoriphagus sp.]MDP3199101.1 universal stress protein [Algoriphagus sp.]MDP3472581.1 universal stress protein [Algoriphagus sp.]